MYRIKVSRRKKINFEKNFTDYNTLRSFTYQGVFSHIKGTQPIATASKFFLKNKSKTFGMLSSNKHFLYNNKDDNFRGDQMDIFSTQITSHRALNLYANGGKPW